MKTINKEKSAAIAGLMSSLQQPFTYIMGVTSILAEENACFYFNMSILSFESNGVEVKHFKCNDCGKTLSLKDLKSSMI